jgi:hypothetical protein
MRAGDAAFTHREDAARLAEAIARYREAAALRAGDVSARLGIARAQAFRARASPAEAREAWRDCARAAEEALEAVAPGFAEALEKGDKGQDMAHAAAAVNARGAEPLYWMALATMGMAQERGMVALLAVKDAARAMMERAGELDERIDYGGPRRALGAWLATLPSAAGGGAAAARRQLEKALALFPAYQLTRVIDAQVLAVLLQDKARFEAELNQVLAFDESKAPEIGPENRLAKKLARELLARRGRLF